MSDRPQVYNKIHKRNFEMSLLNAEKILNDRIHQTMSDIYTPKLFERANRNKLVLNKSPIFKKWANSSTKQTYVFSLEIMHRKANKQQSLDKIVRSFPESVKCLHTDFRRDTGYNSFVPFRNRMTALFPKIINSISLSYFRMDGKQLSKVLLAARNATKISFSRCSIEEKEFIVWEDAYYKIREMSFTN
mmetsp:Transcript_16398/g.16115  ORF Transcript_16398/g.16115 Transcript_16398/m.16115 type:complete len:189 (-) Transcript_16398:273-839(-)